MCEAPGVGWKDREEDQLWSNLSWWIHNLSGDEELLVYIYGVVSNQSRKILKKCWRRIVGGGIDYLIFIFLNIYSFKKSQDLYYKNRKQSKNPSDPKILYCIFNG